jgi:CRISPR-associated protein Csm4
MLVYIKPLSTFPKLHSDTLFGAILSAISELYPDKVDNIVNEFECGKPPFLISSTFPTIFDGEKNIKFYPKLIMGSDLTGIDSKIIKDYKKVDYLDEKLFIDLINGKMSEKELLDNYDEYYRYSNLLMSEKVDVDIGFGRNILPNNSVNRLIHETNIFYTEGDSYNNLGLFFLIKIFNEDFKDILQSSIKFLKDRGFGRDISTGKGQFEYSIEDVDNNFDNDDGNMFVTLSRFIPSSDDLKKINEYSFYEIDSKRGRDKSGEIRKQVRFFKEGSIFPNYQAYYGEIFKSGKINPAIEYGYSFPIRFNMEMKK